MSTQRAFSGPQPAWDVLALVPAMLVALIYHQYAASHAPHAWLSSNGYGWLPILYFVAVSLAVRQRVAAGCRACMLRVHRARSILSCHTCWASSKRWQMMLSNNSSYQQSACASCCRAYQDLIHSSNKLRPYTCFVLRILEMALLTQCCAWILPRLGSLTVGWWPTCALLLTGIMAAVQIAGTRWRPAPIATAPSTSAAWVADAAAARDTAPSTLVSYVSAPEVNVRHADQPQCKQASSVCSLRSSASSMDSSSSNSSTPDVYCCLEPATATAAVTTDSESHTGSISNTSVSHDGDSSAQLQTSKLRATECNNRMESKVRVRGATLEASGTPLNNCLCADAAQPLSMRSTIDTPAMLAQTAADGSKALITTAATAAAAGAAAAGGRALCQAAASSTHKAIMPTAAPAAGGQHSRIAAVSTAALFGQHSHHAKRARRSVCESLAQRVHSQPYVSKLHPRTKVCIKVATDMQLPELPANLAGQLRTALTNIGYPTYHMLDVAARPGCILLSLELYKEQSDTAHNYTTAVDSDHGSKLAIQEPGFDAEAREVAQALLQPISQLLSGQPGSSRGSSRVVAAPPDRRRKSGMEVQHASESVIWVGNVPFNVSWEPDSDSWVLAPADADGVTTALQALLPCADDDSAQCILLVLGSRFGTDVRMGCAAAAAAATEATSLHQVSLSMQLMATAQDVGQGPDTVGCMLVSGWTADTAGMHEATQPSDRLSIMARCNGSYLTTTVQPADDADLEDRDQDSHAQHQDAAACVTAASQLKVQLQVPDDLLPRHHMGAAAVGVLPITVELWQGVRCISSTAVLLQTTPAQQTSHVWWWGASARSVGPALQQLQRLGEQLQHSALPAAAATTVAAAAAQTQPLSTTEPEPVEPSNSSVSSARLPESPQASLHAASGLHSAMWPELHQAGLKTILGWQAFMADMTTWLQHMQQVYPLAPNGCLSKPQSTRTVPGTSLPTPALTPAMLLQLGQNLAKYAEHIGLQHVRVMLMQQMNVARTWANEHTASSAYTTTTITITNNNNNNTNDSINTSGNNSNSSGKGGTVAMAAAGRLLRASIIGLPCPQCETRCRARLSEQLAAVQVYSSMATSLVGIFSFPRMYAMGDNILVWVPAVVARTVLWVHGMFLTLPTQAWLSETSSTPSERPQPIRKCKTLSLVVYITRCVPQLMWGLGILPVAVTYHMLLKRHMIFAYTLLLSLGEQLQMAVQIPIPGSLLLACMFEVFSHMMVAARVGLATPLLLLGLVISKVGSSLAMDMKMRSLVINAWANPSSGTAGVDRTAATGKATIPARQETARSKWC